MRVSTTESGFKPEKYKEKKTSEQKQYGTSLKDVGTPPPPAPGVHAFSLPVLTFKETQRLGCSQKLDVLQVSERKHCLSRFSSVNTSGDITHTHPPDM